MDFKFVGTEDVLDLIRNSEASYDYVRPLVDGSMQGGATWDDDDYHRARKIIWVGTAGYLVRVPSKNIHFMEENQWYPEHAAALVEGVLERTRDTLQAPAGRVYRVTASDVKLSEKYAKAGELEYQMNMLEPWKRSEIGEYHAQLLDGNHRAAAALILREPFVFVYVGENYRANIRKKDWE